MAVGACMRRSMRLGETVSRYGGEEFVALVQGDMRRACVVAERVRAAVEALDVRAGDGVSLRVTVSIGVSARVMKLDGTDAAEAAHALIDSADRAMYAAKCGGRNRVETQRTEGVGAA
jgi:diguanylate cyclase (GGDEF)-like protein